MTISTFKRNVYGEAPVGKDKSKNSGVARAYREHKREEARERDADHAEDVERTARDHNVDTDTARDVVRARKRMLHKRAERMSSRVRRTRA